MKKFEVILISIFIYNSLFADPSPIGYYFCMNIKTNDSILYSQNSSAYFYFLGAFNEDSLKLFNDNEDAFKRFIIVNFAVNDSLILYSNTLDINAYTTIFPTDAKIKIPIRNIQQISYLKAKPLSLGCYVISPVSKKDLNWIGNSKIFKIERLIAGNRDYTFYFYDLTEENNTAVFNFETKILKETTNPDYIQLIMNRLLKLKIIVELCEYD